MAPKDFRSQRKERQQQDTPPQGIVVPEDIYTIALPSQKADSPLPGETVQLSDGEIDHEPAEDDQVVKTSFYPRQDQLEKLDDLASEYNKLYRRQRRRINRNHIVRFLIDQCTLESLSDLQI